MGVKKEKKPIEVSEIDSMAVRLRALGITCAFVAETVKRQGETKILAENVTTLRDVVEDVRRGIDKLQSAANELVVQKTIEAEVSPPKKKKGGE